MGSACCQILRRISVGRPGNIGKVVISAILNCLVGVEAVSLEREDVALRMCSVGGFETLSASPRLRQLADSSSLRRYTIDQGSPCPLATLNPFGRELLLSDVSTGIKWSTWIERSIMYMIMYMIMNINMTMNMAMNMIMNMRVM